MTDRETPLPALGQPDAEPAPESDDDFAGEHDDTAVDEDILTGVDDREPESPRGWAGLERPEVTAD
ncbi:hypothetical protein [Micromonospora sp. NPDC049679]|uniref:hypothetical protein n=1 Tax=Micromonospora sp. NPDC049679 TaxID=3155920 RepID=UPI0034010C54